MAQMPDYYEKAVRTLEDMREEYIKTSEIKSPVESIDYVLSCLAEVTAMQDWETCDGTDPKCLTAEGCQCFG